MFLAPTLCSFCIYELELPPRNPRVCLIHLPHVHTLQVFECERREGMEVGVTKLRPDVRSEDRILLALGEGRPGIGMPEQSLAGGSRPSGVDGLSRLLGEDPSIPVSG